MEKIGRIRKRLGNFKNLHFFFHRHPLTGHKQVPEGPIHTCACQTVQYCTDSSRACASQSSSKTSPPRNAAKRHLPRRASVRFVVYLRGEVVVLCAFYSILG
jgi:hypothetical protein